jgi:hypothetical protein
VRSRRAVVVAVAVLVAVLVVAVVVLTQVHPGAGTANGTGLTYEGRFYWASDRPVSQVALGRPLAYGVAFQETTADLCAIKGLDPKTTLAALLPPVPRSAGGRRWMLVSTDMGRGTDPAAYDDTRAVLAPSPAP